MSIVQPTGVCIGDPESSSSPRDTTSTRSILYSEELLYHSYRENPVTKNEELYSAVPISFLVFSDSGSEIVFEY